MFGPLFLVQAEIANASFPRSGHCYVDLVEEIKGKQIALMKGVMWQDKVVAVRKELGTAFEACFAKGAVVVFRARVSFHDIYGLQLELVDVDLTAMLGDVERRRQETLDKLSEMGVLELNAQIPLPRVLQHVALICSATSDARFDFRNQLTANDFGYQFSVHEIHSSVQGAQARSELLAALERAEKLPCDAIVFIRGGGSPIDLDCFNDFDLCLRIAKCKLPVLTGIGHERDVTIADHVAHSNFKTPTAVAEFTLATAIAFESSMGELYTHVVSQTRRHIQRCQSQLILCFQTLKQRPVQWCQLRRGSLSQISSLFARRVHQDIGGHLARLGISHSTLLSSSARIAAGAQVQLVETLQNLATAAVRSVQRAEERLKAIGQTLDLVSPEKTLSRGFTITRKDSKAILSVRDVEKGDSLETTFADGTVFSTANGNSDERSEPRE